MSSCKSITATLLAEHGIDVAPGRKTDCPYCGHSTLQVRRDDTLAKCFHPTCGRYMHVSSKNHGHADPLHSFMAELFNNFHAALLAGRDKARGAYDYCLRERGIHPQVIADSMIGEVPANYDLDAALDPLIAKAVVAGEEDSQSELKQLREIPEKLRYLQNIAGWLAFFYADENHRLVAMRFRKPYAKQFLLFKATDSMGVFNRELFSPSADAEDRELNERMLVVEGEFNQLQLQSLYARKSEANGRPPQYGYLSACAVGGVANVDVKTLIGTGSKLVVCYDNDSSGAGFKLVERLREVATIRAFTTPGEDSDLDTFIRSFADDHAGAINALRSLLQNSDIYGRKYDAIRAEVDVLRRNDGRSGEKLKAFEVARRVAELIVSDLGERGRFYQDDVAGYLFLGAERELIRVAPGELRLELLLKNFGILPSEKLFEHVLAELRLEAFGEGTSTRVFQFTHYDREKNLLYVCNFNQQVYRISSDKIETVPNGTDGVLFLSSSTCSPFEKVDVDAGRSYLEEVILGKIAFSQDSLTPEDRKLLFQHWLLALFFPELFPTRPILAVVGTKGSGKSSLLRMVGKVLFGARFDVMPLSADPRDFDAAITNEALVAVDNADNKSKWLEDKLAVAATGGKIRRRNYFTTNDLVEFPITAFLAITSRTPHFTREDVAERLLLMFVNRLENFVSEAVLLAEIDENRNLIMSEVLGRLQAVVRALKQEKDAVFRTPFRMADFASFVLKIAHAQGWGEEMESILGRMASEQCSFTASSDPVIAAIEVWLQKPENDGRELSSVALLSELITSQQVVGLSFEYAGNPNGFGQHLTSIAETLRKRFGFTERRGSGGKRLVRFNRPDPVILLPQNELGTAPFTL